MLNKIHSQLVMKKRILLSLSLVLPFTFFAQTVQNVSPNGLTGTTTQATTFNRGDLQTAGTIPANQVSINPPGGPTLQVSGSSGHNCATHTLTQQHYEDRGLKHAFNSSALQGAQSMSAQLGAMKTSGVNEIAIIFHVVHNTNNPAENVSNALIMQVYDDLVEDFLLLNANAAAARTGAPFNFVPSNSNINFCLATRDEFGTPLFEVGVTRVATTEEWYDSNNGEENKMKATATGGSQIWDRNQYLNVWICDISNGAGSGTAGYAYRPSPTLLPSSAIDGIVLDYNLGMNNENVLTHEAGHYLGLDHTWGGSGGCGSDDGFTDTPLTTGPSFDYPGSCSGSQQTCGAIETQYENYMDYANCTVMFTLEQSAYMLSILQGIRGSLLLSPGCDPVAAPPVVNFIADIPDPIIIPVGGSVNFTSLATNTPFAWTWDFSGGSPNQTVENPNTTWNTIGLYTVTHTATNAFGTGSLTKVDHVQVVPAATGLACDTLRNYNPADPFYFLTVGAQYIEGNLNLAGLGDALSWAEPYTAPLSTEVRRLEFIPGVVSDGGGNVTFTVWGPGVAPGAILATEVVPLANLTALQVNQVDFTVPATVTGNFWVGYTLSYAGIDTFALLGTLPATNFSWADFSIAGWTDLGTIFANDFAFVMDVLTSNGPPPVANFTFSESEICAGGQITVNGSSSTNTTDYLWFVTDNPFTTIFEIQSGAGQTFTHPAPGNESIYLFADGSCMTSAVVLNVAIYPPVTFTATITNTSCGNNNGIITISGEAGGTGAIPVYTYSLDGINYQPSNVFSNLAAGTYTVYVTTDGSNCEGTLVVVVGPSVPFVATVGPNQSYCVGGSATITAGAGLGFTYEWYDGATLIATTQSTVVSPIVTTQYMCIVTNAALCQSTVFVTITVNQDPTPPIITPGGPTTFCAGGSVNLTSSEAIGNLWSTTEVTQTIAVSTTGSYTVTYTDPNGCSATSLPTAVTVNPLPAAPIITPSGPTTVCDGGTVDLTSSYGFGNLWSTTEITNVITVGITGAYTVTHTDINGCSQISLPINITVEPPYIIALGTVVDPTTCLGTDGTIQITGTGTGTVNWTGTAAGTSGAITLPYTITGLGAGTYNIDFTSTGGC
ncbi:MAG: PKD repeat protein, partial [Crocinitomicaceae bacterium]